MIRKRTLSGVIGFCLGTFLFASVFSHRVTAQVRLRLHRQQQNLPVKQEVLGPWKTISINDKPLLQVKFSEASRPYVAKLRTPSGINVVDDSPPDHPHHHGLMFALGANGIDFWAEWKDSGLQKELPATSISRVAAVDDNQIALQRSRVLWLASDGKTAVLTEQRELRWGYCRHLVAAGNGDCIVLRWSSTLEPAEGQQTVELWGREYFGLGMRIAKRLGKPQFFDAEGRQGAKAIDMQQAKWCGFRCRTAEGPVTVVMYGDKSNARGAPLWFCMDEPFGYLSATLGLHKNPLKLNAGDSLQLTYYVFLFDGEPTPKQIENVIQQLLSSEQAFWQILRGQKW